MNLDLAGYDLAPELLQRVPPYLDVLVRNRPDHTAVRLMVAPAVEDMYGNPTGSGISGVPANRRILPDLLPGRSTATKRMWPIAQIAAQEKTKDFARIMLSLEDLDPPIPAGEQVYLAVQQVRPTGPAVTAATTPILGPILVVPSPRTLGEVRPSVLVQCLAPGNTKGKAGASPASVLDPSQAASPPPLVLAMWQQLHAVTLRNMGPDPLLFTFGWGDPYVELAAGSDVDVRTSIKYIFLAGSGSKSVKVAVQGWGFRFGS